MPVYGSHLLKYRDLRLGRRIRDTRQAKQLTLQQVARVSGLSVARLSEIENDLHVLDLAQAYAIADALAVSLESLFPAEHTFPYQITRDADIRARAPKRAMVAASPADTAREHHNLFWPLADCFVGRQIEPLLVRVMPLADDDLTFTYHDEYEFMSVLRGAVELLIRTPDGLRCETLTPGDCTYFASRLPHCLRRSRVRAGRHRGNGVRRQASRGPDTDLCSDRWRRNSRAVHVSVLHQDPERAARLQAVARAPRTGVRLCSRRAVGADDICRGPRGQGACVAGRQLLFGLERAGSCHERNKSSPRRYVSEASSAGTPSL